jgi:DNA repair protein RadC
VINIQKYTLRVVKEKGGRYDLDRRISKPEAARDVFVEVLELHMRAEEVFAMITLDVKNKITGIFEVSVGTLSSSLVAPREVYKRALLQNAAAVIFGHNHPSGEVNASSDDIEITKKLEKGGELLGISVFDHIIVGDRYDFISMKEEGLM